MANRDYSSIYGIKDFILNEIAPSYFKLEDISLLNVGLFGMVTDIGATTTQDNFNVTSRYITELLPGKSVLPEFIYAEAANYGIDNIFATCAKCSGMLFIKEDDIIASSVPETNTDYSRFFIDSDIKVYIGETIFTIPYNIKIRSKKIKDIEGNVINYNYSCTYDTSKLKNSLATIDYPYIKCVKTKVSGTNTSYIAIKVDLYQYNREMISESLVTNQTLNIPYIDIPFEGSLCNFEIMYKPASGTTKVQLQKLQENSPPSGTPFCYYKLLDEHTLRISFTTNDVYFVPEYKSELDIYIYQTDSEKGNFPLYTGNDIHVTASSSDDELDYNNTIAMFCTMTTDSMGGKPNYTPEELARLTWETKLSLQSRTTEDDLNRYFESYTALNDTEATFIKTRDDFATREFSCYTKIKDETEVFPTNTLNIKLNPDNLNGFKITDGKYIIKPGQTFIYDNDSLDDAVVGSGESIEYATPCAISIDTNPNTVAYYINSIDKNVDVEYGYINDDAQYQFIIKSLSITRNAINGDMGYNISLTILPSDSSLLNETVYSDDYSGDDIPDDMPTEGEDNPNESDGLDIRKLKVFIYASTYTGHYIKLTYDNDKSSRDTGYVFSTTLETNDSIYGNSIEITNMTKYGNGEEPNPCSINMIHPNFTIIVFNDEGKITSTGHEYASKIDNTDHLVLCNTFIPNADDYYLAYPLTLFKSNVSFIDNHGLPEAGFNVKISNVPLLSRKFLDNSSNIGMVLDKINTQHEFIMDTLNLLHSNFEIHMKFFNTYGKSRIFLTDIPDESGSNKNKLDTVHCKLTLKLKLFNGIDEAVCLSNIRDTIRLYFESLNDSTSQSRILSISNLLSIIHTTYKDEVEAIVFENFNSYGKSVQLIYSSGDITEFQKINSIPEFLTINEEDITLTTI